MISRPYSSLNGASRSGPDANPNTKMEMENVANRGEGVCKSVMIRGMAGAGADETKGLFHVSLFDS